MRKSQRTDSWIEKKKSIAQQRRHSRCVPMPSAQIQPNPVTQLKMGLLFGDALGRLTDFAWNPTWKRDRADSVRPRPRVFLL